MLFRQFVDDDLGCASYLIGDPDAGIAVLVDPAYAIEPYLEAADEERVRIIRALETHTHADHVSGHGRLALDHDVAVLINPLAEPDYPFEPLDDGRELDLGHVTIRAVHTPGHRPEHTALVVLADGEPRHVLTGDSLFVGSVARPDLAVEAREGAEGMFRSLRRLLELPDAVEVDPGHVAGSLCGAGMSGAPSSTIASERASNPFLALLDDEHRFVAETVGTAGIRPPNVERIVALNRGPFVSAPEPLDELGSADGAVVLDVRDPEAFARGHVPGAINVPLGVSRFATKAGFVLCDGDRIAIHATSDADADRAARALRAVGFLELAGRLAEPETSEHVEPVDIDELERLLAGGGARVVDVREKDERDDGYIAGSMHMPYRLLRACGEDLAAGDAPVVTICESGERAGIAASVLAHEGVNARPVLGGGIPDWQARGGRMVEFRRCGS